MIKNLYENVKHISEGTLAQKLTKAVGMDESKADGIVKKLMFTDYIKLASAIDSGNITEVNEIIGEEMIEEADNSYAAIRKPTSANDTSTDAKVTQVNRAAKTAKLRTSDGTKDIDLDSVEDLASMHDEDGEKIDPSKLRTGDDVTTSIEEDLQRIKELAGISAEVDENATSGGSSAGGMASAPTGKHSKKSPGTVVGSKKYTGY